MSVAWSRCDITEPRDTCSPSANWGCSFPGPNGTAHQLRVGARLGLGTPLSLKAVGSGRNLIRRKSHGTSQGQGRSRTTKPAPGHKIYPYLLRNMTIDRPNQVWAVDITYLPIGRGFLYLVAIIDWASRAVLAVLPDWIASR